VLVEEINVWLEVVPNTMVLMVSQICCGIRVRKE
jgi:hypothetical protein